MEYKPSTLSSYEKIYLLISVVLLVMASSCVEDKILTYDDANYVQFTKNIKGQTICSF